MSRVSPTNPVISSPSRATTDPSGATISAWPSSNLAENPRGHTRSTGLPSRYSNVTASPSRSMRTALMRAAGQAQFAGWDVVGAVVLSVRDIAPEGRGTGVRGLAWAAHAARNAARMTEQIGPQYLTGKPSTLPYRAVAESPSYGTIAVVAARRSSGIHPTGNSRGGRPPRRAPTSGRHCPRQIARRCRSRGLPVPTPLANRAARHCRRPQL